MLFAVLFGFLLAPFAPWLDRRIGARWGWTWALPPLGLLFFFLSFLPSLACGEVHTRSVPWIPRLGVHLSFYLDGWSLLFAVLISGIGAFIFLYAARYLEGHPQRGRFFMFLLGFMASMLGLVLADNAIALFVFWELTSLTSYLLIGFEHERESARSAALQALVVTGLGGLALMAGWLLLGEIGGSFELSELREQRAFILAHPHSQWALALLLLGAFTKSAQFPFHFWLPNAMEAPTPVSAYLHSATMVKAGVYLLARIHSTLGGTDFWSLTITPIGAATLGLGALLALRQREAKRLLAYSTVSALGLLTLLVGVGTSAALTAMVVVLLAHALYKAALFLIAGILDHETGVREPERLSGLRRAMPITTAAAMLAAASFAGFPPALGFLGKEMVYEALRAEQRELPFLFGVAVLAGTALVAAAGIIGVRPFVGRMPTSFSPPHEAPRSLWLGPLILGVTGMLMGIAPASIERMVVNPAATAIVGEPTRAHLAVWHGVTPTLLWSVLTLLGGVGMYAGRHLVRAVAVPRALTYWRPSDMYALLMSGLYGLARLQTRLLQSGYLRYYLLMIIGWTVGVAGYPLLAERGLIAFEAFSRGRVVEIALAGLIVAAAVAAVRFTSRLAAIAALGVVGYTIALFYMIFGAPDLALTQFMIESLTVILFVLVFYYLPRFATLSSPRARVRDILMCGLAGSLVGGLVLSILRMPPPATISEYFARESVPMAHGRNVVNVILVDFRALDTLGEITVLALAGIGVYVLLRLRLEDRQ
ncbi:MAG: putative monovalent cation/H+ antiporter subunit A [Blastocatellia bacterium]|nr:putative monovalent cation/H+ antiporter subunit A [Blastocatellia bacterium]MCS7156681.1 putative monovalent cation/H+ antiporter subunit A [Blastocatellia bacterium]MCX7751577.1 putative monovalent cation/H+ antiporter subunit A [Blastocatellia bacterium]MDW8168677.1 putative monovalent cation/H+ antiporter subunit A [Acidobacteriota bacterium]MDW8255840.1 putative monovalent cation/H+ antiporter subunit A [Acidobacteriota bacterium]